jgi:hypothetical protein
MKIVELKIDDSVISGFDATALVESPAIEENFIAFNKVNMAEMTYNDYPQAAIDAARRGIELNEKNNMKCATQVGKVRAQQLVNGEKLSLDTIQRMRSFLIRQKGNFELATRRKDYNACGYISYLLWGGEAALPWAEKKLRQAGIEFSAYSELKSNIPQIAPNEPVNFEGLEDACQRGYKAIGLKTKNGRKVPNCVPIENFSDELANYIIADLLGLDEEDFAANIISFDYHDTLNTERGKILAKKLMNEGNIIYVISGADSPEEIYPTSRELGIPDECVYAVGSNKAKVELIKKLGIVKHYDNNEDVIAELGAVGEQFEINVAALPNYVNEASTGGRKRNFTVELAEKQMLIGPLMTPGKLIPRLDEETGEEYQVFFSVDTIEKIAYKMMQDKLVDSVNIEHDGAHRVDDAYLIETWIVKDPEKDKSALYGFQPIKGQWFGIYKIDNGPVWNEYIKTGKVKGFSVEGYFYNNVLTKK